MVETFSFQYNPPDTVKFEFNQKGDECRFIRFDVLDNHGEYYIGINLIEIFKEQTDTIADATHTLESDDIKPNTAENIYN